MLLTLFYCIFTSFSNLLRALKFNEMRQRFEHLEYIWMDDPSCMWDYLNEKPTLLRLKSPNLNKHLSLCFWCIGIHRTCKAHISHNHTTVGGVLFISWCTFWQRKRVILAHFIFIITFTIMPSSPLPVMIKVPFPLSTIGLHTYQQNVTRDWWKRISFEDFYSQST